MAYVDYKCLESLLIEGEDLIATEGIGNIIINLVKGFLKIINNAISVIIKCFKNLFAKLKRSKGRSNNKSDTKSSNVNKNNNEHNAQRDTNIKKSEDELKKIHEDFKKMHEDSEKDLAERTKKLEEQKKQFAEKHNKRKAELDEAIKRMNKTVYGNDEDDDNAPSGSRIARDILQSIRYIEQMTMNAEHCMAAFIKNRTQEDFEDALPETTKIKELITDIDSMQTSITFYELAEDKLSDSNKDEICNKLQTVTNKLEATKTKFEKHQYPMPDRLDYFYIQSNNTNNKTDQERSKVFNYVNRQIKIIQNGLIKSQKLAISLMKII